jgi:hypothetical protein
VLFVSLLTAKDAPSEERLALRANWKPPAGVKPVAEYWLQSSSVNVIYVFESDSVEAMLQMRAYWTDTYEMETSPALAAADAMQLLGKRQTAD